jgi:hypothetical protein
MTQDSHGHPRVDVESSQERGAGLKHAAQAARCPPSNALSQSEFSVRQDPELRSLRDDCLLC